MPRRVTVLLLATLSVLGALAPAASAASADPYKASCVAENEQQGPGEVGETISFLSHEAQPFGTTVVSLGADLKPPCE